MGYELSTGDDGVQQAGGSGGKSGRPGAAKSTVMKLLRRLRNPFVGVIALAVVLAGGIGAMAAMSGTPHVHAVKTSAAAPVQLPSAPTTTYPTVAPLPSASTPSTSTPSVIQPTPSTPTPSTQPQAPTPTSSSPAASTTATTVPAPCQNPMPNVIGMTWREANDALATALNGRAQIREINEDNQGIVISSDPPAGYCLDAVLAPGSTDILAIPITLTT